MWAFGFVGFILFKGLGRIWGTSRGGLEDRGGTFEWKGDIRAQARQTHRHKRRRSPNYSAAASFMGMVRGSFPDGIAAPNLEVQFETSSAKWLLWLPRIGGVGGHSCNVINHSCASVIFRRFNCTVHIASTTTKVLITESCNKFLAVGQRPQYQSPDLRQSTTSTVTNSSFPNVS